MNEEKYTTTKIQMPELPKLEYKTLWGWYFKNWEDGPEPNEDTFYAVLPIVFV